MALDRGGEVNEIGTKPHGFEDKSDSRDGELDLFVVGLGGKTHELGALVVDPLADLGNRSRIQRT